MAQLNHQKIFDLLIDEVLEAYPHIEGKLDFVSRDILEHLKSRSNQVKERLRQGSFTKDDGQIDQREAFLLTWIEKVWEAQNGNQELYEKLLNHLNGTPQEFDLYDREVP
ncbi:MULTISPECIES: hypothetical protein [unclassified Roseofilum]|uniref:hypothetical protein n=1 Tax=unclassified Roseofilum TaxID=2620099 RepID=UPI000E9969A4|nr:MULTISPECIES: hypothetical protein [unclassified Roseofilum]HBQ97404.1 hypothetical protein [Cyanobacteria bacterium UBA11691]MBP0010167.1 hypothetical protein [Roseofilum sp. Belize Diploria]MBP0015812.1 hypothetical protein [Roseofilum sp. SID3]MBP0022732.1 hypothetical protein [Roseofilum sp. SID2]MBP0034731.1 hypothetical protein [Roseofilum sp. Belize BBD 4]